MSNSAVKKRKLTGKAGRSDASLYPQARGRLWDPNKPSPEGDRVQRQFLDAYFRINKAYAKLVALRTQWDSRPPKAAERALLRKIEQALVAREALEDRHACRGLIATPVYRDGFAVEILFSDAHAAHENGRVLGASSSSVRFAIPLPAALRAKLCKN
jgi:hypothetical protein